jgi:hypothetical protein
MLGAIERRCAGSNRKSNLISSRLAIIFGGVTQLTRTDASAGAIWLSRYGCRRAVDGRYSGRGGEKAETIQITNFDIRDDEHGTCTRPTDQRYESLF